MVSDYKELCARLRMACYCGELQGAGTCQPCLSADAIEAQAREIEELKRRAEAAGKSAHMHRKDADALRARAEAAERELDEERLKALSSEGQWIEHSEKLAAERDAALRKVEELRGLLREVVEVVAACHNCLSYEAPELADRVDAALGEKR